jgi:hypothetical protein
MASLHRNTHYFIRRYTTCLIAVLALLLISSSICLIASSPTNKIYIPLMHMKSAKLYGVLQPKPGYLASAINAGIQVRSLELGWDHYEPQAGTWNRAYIDSRKTEYQQMLNAGIKVVLDFGIQYPPAWVKAIRPWQDQYGHSYDGTANAIWSPVVREKIAIYIQHVFQDFGTNFLAVRLGSGGWVETLYPDNVPGFQFSYWAFDPDAMASNPVPSWRPGQPSPNGEAQTFYNWYLQHLIDTMNWQQDVVRQYYNGYLLQIFTGQGVRPSQWDTLIETNLTPFGRHIFAAERGAVWDRVLKGMHNRAQVVLYCSSIADNSAITPNLNEASADPLNWSSTHWIAANADRYDMLKWGENAGHDNFTTMQIAFQQVDAYDLMGLIWAYEPDLHSGTYATLKQYAELISKHR